MNLRKAFEIVREHAGNCHTCPIPCIGEDCEYSRDFREAFQAIIEASMGRVCRDCNYYHPYMSCVHNGVKSCTAKEGECAYQKGEI